jgi:hypothetical protein
MGQITRMGKGSRLQHQPPTAQSNQCDEAGCVPPHRRPVFLLGAGLVLAGTLFAKAQIDPQPRSLLQLGYDLALSDQGPKSLYAYYYYNDPELISTNLALRLAVAPIYLDGEIGFRQVLSPHTHAGIGVFGGGFGENYYEVREGHYYKEESYNGHGGGTSLNLYHRINPRHRIPLHLVAKSGVHYSAYTATSKTADDFMLPDDRLGAFARAGLRLGGKEPLLYPDLAMEFSVWIERQWRFDHGQYGFPDDPRFVEAVTDLYWVHGSMSYAWTNTGNQIALSLTAGGSEDADRFSAWRLGGVLPLAAELPLTLPGYFYEEISARRFLHINAAYVAPLSANRCWQLRLGVASAYVDYLPGFELPDRWQTGVGPSLSYTSPGDVWRVVVRYGYGFNALRDGKSGAQSVGLLFQYNFERRKQLNGDRRW